MLVFYSWLCTCPYPGLLSIWFPSKWTCSPYHFTLYVLFVLSRSFLALSSTMNLYPQDVIHSIDNLRFDKQPSPSFLHGYAYLYDKLYSSSLFVVINSVLDASSNVRPPPLTFWTRRYSIWAYASIKTRLLSSRLFPFLKKESAIPPLPTQPSTMYRVSSSLIR